VLVFGHDEHENEGTIMTRFELTHIHNFRENVFRFVTIGKNEDTGDLFVERVFEHENQETVIRLARKYCPELKNVRIKRVP